MKRIRNQLSYANVISTLALFLVLGGGTALAAVVVTSNADIAPDTVAGHSPPTGDHSNVIGGSINDRDVAPNGLTGAAVLERTLTGNAQRVAYHDGATTTDTKTTIVNLGGYRVKAQCHDNSNGHMTLHLYANGPLGTVNWTGNQTENDSTDFGTRSNGFWLPARTDTEITSMDARDGDYERLGGTIMLNSGTAGSVLVQVDFNAVADLRSAPGGCLIVGTATRAS
jgi:hypothetical protein